MYYDEKTGKWIRFFGSAPVSDSYWDILAKKDNPSLDELHREFGKHEIDVLKRNYGKEKDL